MAAQRPTSRLARRSAHYDAGRRGRSTAGWIPLDGAPADAVRTSLKTARTRARDLDRNNPLAHHGALLYAVGLVGAGIRPTFADQTAQALWDAWAPWASSESSVDGVQRLDVYGLWFQAVHAMVVSGESLIRFRPRRQADRLPVPLQLELLEADLLDHDRTEQLDNNGGIIRNGVEYGPTGAIQGYWLFDSHPSDFLIGTSLQSRRIPARQILHLFDQILARPGQPRGMPLFSSVMLRLRHWDDWTSADLIRKRMEACIGGVIEGGTFGDAEAWIGTDTDNPNGPFRYPVDAYGRRVDGYEPGMLMQLPPGTTFKPIQPQAAADKGEQQKQTQREVAAGLHMPYERLTGDLSNANYSSLRAGLGPWFEWLGSLHGLVIMPLMLRPIVARFLERGIMSGALADRDYRVTWRRPRRAPVDPVKDAEANERNLRNALTTHSDILAGEGESFEEMLERRQRDQALMAAAGVVSGADARLSLAAARPAPEEDEGDDDDDDEGGDSEAVRIVPLDTPARARLMLGS